MDRQLHIFDFSFMLSDKTDFGHPWDYYYSLKDDEFVSAMIVGGQVPVWDLIKGEDTLFNLKHEREQYNSYLSHVLFETDKVFIYYGDKRYTVDVIDWDEGFIFNINEFDTIKDLIETFESLKRQESLDKAKKQLEKYFENNMEMTFDE